MIRLSTAFAATCALAIAAPHTMAANRVLIIGVAKYVGSTETIPVPYAENDARLFDNFSIQKQLDPNPVILNSATATLAATQFQLGRILEQAGDKDTVYIFISSRGIARPSLGGYLGTADMVASKPESTGLPVDYLAKLIKGSSAARVIVFADVCRKPPETFSNQINKRLAELGAIARPAVAGVLASQPGQTSDERADSKYAPGYGLFGFYLANSGAAGTNGVPGVSSELLRSLAEATNGKQKPTDFGAPQAKTPPLWRAANDFHPPELRAQFPKLPGQLASLLWFAGLLAMQTQQSPTRLDSIKAELLKRDTPVHDPLSLANDLLGLNQTTPHDQWDEVDALAITRLASDAQRVVDSYGMDSLLPDDPLRVTTAAAGRAAKEFEAALKLAPGGDHYRDFRDSLEVREYLCQGLAGVVPDINALNNARKSPAIIPEVHNAIGIHYLESQTKDYDMAIREFQQARKASPGWMYPRHNLALAYIENGDYRAAEQEYRQAIATDPLQPYLYYNLGLLLHRMNRRNEAKSTYQKALESYDRAIAELRLRTAEWQNDLPKDSALAARRTEVFEKGRAEVFNARGALLATSRDTNSALADYKNAISADPDLCPARDNLAALEQTLAERANKNSVSTEAIEQLNQNLSRSKCAAFFPSLLMRARLEKKTGDLTKARADFSTVHTQLPSNIDAISGMAAIDAANRQFDSAVALLNQAIAIESRPEIMAYPSLYVDLAEVYRQSGNVEACRQSYALALQASNGAVYNLSKKELRKRAACTVTAIPAPPTPAIR